MKKLFYVLSLAVALAGLDACKGKDPEPVAPVVGKWSSDRIRLSGFVAPYTSYNNQEFDAYDFAGVRNSYDIKSDKTFTLSDRSSGQIQDSPGTWDYTGTDLTLKFDDGDQGKLTYDATTKPSTPVLLSPVIAVSLPDSSLNPTSKKGDLVKFNLQLVYTK